MKICFYIHNKTTKTVDCRDVESGNPGIGGTEYSCILIASLLNKRNNGIEVELLADVDGLFPKHLKVIECGDYEGALKYSASNNFDYTIVDARMLKKYYVAKYNNIRFIGWANCFIEKNKLDFISNRNNIIGIVNVGKEQNKLLSTHNISRKSTFIFNAVPTKILEKYPTLSNAINRNNNVVYIGSLHPTKGFGYLAKAWPQIIKEIPDANLYVIGSNRLYGRDRKLGKYGIASESFEKEIMKYLAPNNTEIMPSVHFLGILGLEKYDILSQCKVGVPNPSGESETFGYTAVEMQIMGCKVTTIKCPGYIDTVYQSESLYSNTDELANYVIKELKNPQSNYNQTLDYIKKFSPEIIVQEWESYLKQIPHTPLPQNKNKIADNLFITSFNIYRFLYLIMRGIYRKTIKKWYLIK